jgi:hypothetical protein
LGSRTEILGKFLMWCWRMEKIRRTDRVRNEEVLYKDNEERNIIHTINWMKTNWIGHVLRLNCLLKHTAEGNIEGSIEVTGRRERRGKQLLESLKENRGYWKLKEEVLALTLWITRFGRV